ncbi:MAG: hypothetical protein ABR500_10855 [Dermatophilaceae bacterium]
MSGVDLATQAVHLIALVWSVLVPGMLVHRAARGRTDLLVTDVALGFTTGMLLQLVAWATLTAAGLASWQVLWPLSVLVVFAAVPGLRRHFTLAPYPRVLGAGTSWVAVLAGTVPLVSAVTGTFNRTELPPGWSRWYPDTYWYLGGVGELMRAVPPQVPQVSSGTFDYHWFSQASMAAMAHTSGIDPVVVVGRLWLPPLLWAVVGMSIALAVQLSGRAWPGALAAVLITMEAEVRVAQWFSMPGFETMTFLSPSQIYTIPILFLTLIPLVDLIRGRDLGAGWLVLGLALIGCAGGKSSALPVVVSGLLLVVVLAWAANRWGWPLRDSGSLRGSVIALAAVVPAQIVGLWFAGAGSAGAGIKLFAIVGASQPWTKAYGSPPLERFLDPVLTMPAPSARILLFLLLVLLVVAAGHVLIALPLLRRSLVAWLLLGVGFAGLCAMLLVNQDGLSQAYFLRGAVPALHLLAAWGFCYWWLEARRTRGASPLAWLVVIFGALGMVTSWGLAAIFVEPAAGRVVHQVAALTVVSVGLLIVGVGVSLREGPWPLAGLLSSSAVLGAALRVPIQEALGPAAVLGAALAAMACYALLKGLGRETAGRFVAVTAAGLAATAVVTVGGLTSYRSPWSEMPPDAQTAEEISAARWLRDHSAPFDLVATNVHCTNHPTRTGCDARAFWISGYAERRVLIEGWAYTHEAHAQHGVDGQSSRVAPFHDQELLGLNEAAFYSPDEAVIDALRARGVTWLFANSLAGDLSTDIGRFADLVHEAGPVQIYRLP